MNHFWKHFAALSSIGGFGLCGAPLTPRNDACFKVFGANMWNDYPHYLKIGLYHNSEITTTNSIFFDEVRIGNSCAQVAPPSAAKKSDAKAKVPSP